MSQTSVVRVTKALLFQLSNHSQKWSQLKKLKLYLNLQKILDQPQNLKLILILENQLLGIKITMRSWEKFQNRKPCLMMKMKKSTLFLVQLVPKKNKLKIFSKTNPPKLKEQYRKKKKEKERKHKWLWVGVPLKIHFLKRKIWLNPFWVRKISPRRIWFFKILIKIKPPSPDLSKKHKPRRTFNHRKRVFQ